MKRQTDRAASALSDKSLMPGIGIWLITEDGDCTRWRRKASRPQLSQEPQFRLDTVAVAILQASLRGMPPSTTGGFRCRAATRRAPTSTTGNGLVFALCSSRVERVSRQLLFKLYLSVAFVSSADGLPRWGFSNADSSHSSFSYAAPRASASASVIPIFSKSSFFYRSWPDIHSYLYVTSVWNPSMLPVSPWPWIELNFTSRIS